MEGNIKKIIVRATIIIFLILIVGYFIYGIYLREYANRLCKKECNALGGLHSQRIPNGELNTDDLCICYFEDKIKAFRLGERR